MEAEKQTCQQRRRNQEYLHSFDNNLTITFKCVQRHSTYQKKLHAVIDYYQKLHFRYELKGLGFIQLKHRLRTPKSNVDSSTNLTQCLSVSTCSSFFFFVFFFFFFFLFFFFFFFLCFFFFLIFLLFLLFLFLFFFFFFFLFIFA